VFVIIVILLGDLLKGLLIDDIIDVIIVKLHIILRCIENFPFGLMIETPD